MFLIIGYHVYNTICLPPPTLSDFLPSLNNFIIKLAILNRFCTYSEIILLEYYVPDMFIRRHSKIEVGTRYLSRLTRIRILFVLKINHFEFLSASLETQKKMGKERVSKEPWRKPCSESRKRIFSILSFTISLYFTTTNLTGTYLDHKMSVNVYNDIFRFSKSLVTLLRKNNKLVYKSMTSLQSCFSSESEDVK